MPSISFFFPRGRKRREISYAHEPSRAKISLIAGRGKSPEKDPSMPRRVWCVSSQSACFVNADWIRPGVACPRLPPVYPLFAVSSSAPFLPSCPRGTRRRDFSPGRLLSASCPRRPLRIHRIRENRGTLPKRYIHSSTPFWEFSTLWE